MPTKEEIISALFPRTVDATYAGSGLARRSLAGTLDAASLPGRAYSALWHRYDEPMLQNMARTTATPGSALAAGVAEGMARDPLTLLSAPVGGLAGSGGRALASGIGSSLLRRAAPVAADAAANAGLSALAQYGTEGRVNLADLAMGTGVGAGMQGAGAAMAKMSPAARAKVMENPAFQKWFGKSKIVDDAGNPLVVYHGGGSSFDQFNTNGGTGKTHGSGAFFSASPDVANTYATGEAKNVMPAYLSMENPAVFDANGMGWNQLGKKTRADLPKTTVSGQADEDLYAALAGTEPQKDVVKTVKARKTSLGKLFPDEFQWGDETFSTDDLASWARKNGHGGVVIKNVVDHGPSGQFASDAARVPSDIYVTFDPTQIKSATGNRGTFDPNDPNITHFAGGQSPIAGANALAGRYFRGLMNQDEKKEKR